MARQTVKEHNELVLRDKRRKLYGGNPADVACSVCLSDMFFKRPDNIFDKLCQRLFSNVNSVAVYRSAICVACGNEEMILE